MLLLFTHVRILTIMTRMDEIFKDRDWLHQEAWEHERRKERKIWLEEKGLTESRDLKDVVADIVGVKASDFKANYRRPATWAVLSDQMKRASALCDGTDADFYKKLKEIEEQYYLEGESK